MKIVFSGTHGTGKTTLLNILKDQTSLLNSYDFVTEVSRTLQKEGKATINENGDDLSQYAIALKNYEIYSTNKNFISDRCLLDVLCYTRYLYLHQRCSKECLMFVEQLFKLCNYDIIFYIEPEFDLVTDGTRSLNKEFRNEVLECFRYYIKEFNINVIRLSGGIDERLKIVKDTIKEKFNNLLK